ncbi:MAG TPA: hypothetical protein VL088_04525 [Pedobacter sp.]|nr:hypothetical protein [Pedobacter sp.]
MTGQIKQLIYTNIDGTANDIEDISVKSFEYSIKSRSKIFTEYFPLQYLGIIKYLIANNKLIFSYEIGVPESEFCEVKRVTKPFYNAKSFNEWDVKKELILKGDEFAYDYNLYPSQYEDSIIRSCLISNYKIHILLLEYIATEFKGLLSFVHLDYSFVNDPSAYDDNLKKIRFILAFETFANEPSFFIQKLNDFKIKFLPSTTTTTTHLASAASLKDYWDCRIKASKSNPIPFAYNYFYCAVDYSRPESTFDTNFYNPRVFSRVNIGRYSSSTVTRALSLFTYDFFNDFEQPDDVINDHLIHFNKFSYAHNTSKLPVYDCFGNWDGRYSAKNCIYLKKQSFGYLDENTEASHQLRDARLCYNYSFASFYIRKYNLFHLDGKIFDSVEKLIIFYDYVLRKEKFRKKHKWLSPSQVEKSVPPPWPLNNNDDSVYGTGIFNFFSNSEELNILACHRNKIKGYDLRYYLCEDLVEFKEFEPKSDDDDDSFDPSHMYIFLSDTDDYCDY